MQHPSRPTEPRQEIVDLAAESSRGWPLGRPATTRPTRSATRTSTSWWLPNTAITVPADLGGMGATAWTWSPPEPAGRGEPGDRPGGQHAPARGRPAGRGVPGTGWSRSSARCATDGVILASGFSSPSRARAWWYQATTATPPARGWLPSVGDQDVLHRPDAGHPPVLSAVETDGGREPIGFLVPRPGQGIRVMATGRRRWACGPPATAPWPSTSWRSRRVRGRHRVPDGGQLPGRVALVVAVVRQRVPGRGRGGVPACDRRPAQAPQRGLGQGLAELPGVQQAVGEMRACGWTRPGRPARRRRRPPDPDPVAHYGRMARAKLFTCQTALEVCTTALRTAGGGATCAPARAGAAAARRPRRPAPAPVPRPPSSSGWAGSSSDEEQPRRGSPAGGSGEPRRGARSINPSQESGSPPVDS